MIKLQNIKKDGDIITALCLPQGKSQNAFELTFNIENREILSIQDIGGGIGHLMQHYAGHAIRAICKAWREENLLPENITSMWY